MSLLKYIERLKRMDDLIRRRATGTPDEFARKLGISKSMLMINLTELRDMGAVMDYDPIKKTYHYSKGCQLTLGFELGRDEGGILKGGNNIFENFPCSNPIRIAQLMFDVHGFGG